MRVTRDTLCFSLTAFHQRCTSLAPPTGQLSAVRPIFTQQRHHTRKPETAARSNETRISQQLQKIARFFFFFSLNSTEKKTIRRCETRGGFTQVTLAEGQVSGRPATEALKRVRAQKWRLKSPPLLITLCTAAAQRAA